MRTFRFVPRTTFLPALSRTKTLTTAFLATTLIGCGPAPSTELAAPIADATFIGAEPHLARADDGTVVLSWLQPDGDGTALRYATRSDGEWSQPRTVTTGTGWFVNWADFPSVSPIRDDLWAAHWLVKRPGGTYAYDVAVALSADRGETWGPPITPHTDGTRTEHGFVTLFPWQGQVGALWLDGREMTAEHGDGHGGGMTLRSAQISAAGELLAGQLVDELVCDCCQTDVAITADGPIAVYRNRTDDETRDIYVARYVAEDGWQPGIPVADDGWEISGCPVNGPAVDAVGNELVVAWFTAPENEARVRLARSSDAGASFSAATDIDRQSPLGRVDVELLDNGDAIVSWLARDDEHGAKISAIRVSKDGSLGMARDIASTRAARASGFPQMLRDGDDLVFAWTDASGDESVVRTAVTPVSAY